MVNQQEDCKLECNWLSPTYVSPFYFQPCTSFQAIHWEPMTTPMRQSVDTSTHTSGSTCCLSSNDWVVHGMHKRTCHHCKLSITGLGMWWQMKSLGNLDRNYERGGRNAWPSQCTKVMCWSVPCIDRHSLCDTLLQHWTWSWKPLTGIWYNFYRIGRPSGCLRMIWIWHMIP